MEHSNGGGRSLNFVQLNGRWTFQLNSATYEGGDPTFIAHGEQFSMGLAISDRTLASGAYQARVRFDTPFGPEQHQAAGLVLGYRSTNHHYLHVQLGAGRVAYSIGEFVPGMGWRLLEATGPLNALREGQDYRLEASIRGQ
ncbi:MAG TPA: hypothetical protein DEH78_13095, partial [Solibacterales bacterium]|nr:hypothetical protein [Bryobacterales bacterium]